MNRGESICVILISRSRCCNRSLLPECKSDYKHDRGFTYWIRFPVTCHGTGLEERTSALDLNFSHRCIIIIIIYVHVMSWRQLYHQPIVVCLSIVTGGFWSRRGGGEETMREEVRVSELICHGEPCRAGHESFSRLSSPWIIVHSKWSQTIGPKETEV